MRLSAEQMDGMLALWKQAMADPHMSGEIRRKVGILPHDGIDRATHIRAAIDRKQALIMRREIALGLNAFAQWVQLAALEQENPGANAECVL